MKSKYILLLFFVFHVSCEWNRLQEEKIKLKYNEADYHVFRFEDDFIYYLSKIESDISKPLQCQINEPQINIQNIKVIQNQRKFHYLGDNQIGYLDANTLNIFLIKEEEKILKFELFALVDIEKIVKIGDSQAHIELDDTHFQISSLKNYFYYSQGSSLKILKFKDNVLIIEENFNMDFQVDLKNNKFIYTLKKHLFRFNFATNTVIQYGIEEGKIKILETIENCIDLINGLDSTVYIIKEHDIIVKTYTSTLFMQYKPRVQLTGLKPDGNLIVCLTENDQVYIENLILKQDKLTSLGLIQPLIGITNMLVSNKNLVLFYKNIVRVYPFIDKERLFSDFFSDMITWNDFAFGVEGLNHDYLVFMEKDKYIYNQITRIKPKIECFKEEEALSSDFSFKIAYLTTRCSFDKNLSLFSNGSCGFIQDFSIHYTYKFDYLFIGVLFVIAILLSVFWIKCILKSKDKLNYPDDPIMPQKEYPKIKKLQPSEVQKFIYEEEPVSEEMRVIPKISHPNIKRNPNIALSIPQNAHLPQHFDTPRFNLARNESDNVPDQFNNEAPIEELVTDENRYTKRNEDSFGEDR